MNILPLSVAVVFMLAAIVLGVALAGCTTTQQTVGCAVGWRWWGIDRRSNRRGSRGRWRSRRWLRRRRPWLTVR